MRPKRVIALVLALAGVVILFLIFDKPPALPPVMILPPGPLAVKSGRAPDRWIPRKWTWLHRACQFFLGPQRVVHINVQFMETSEKVATFMAENSFGQPQAESNGLAVWILPAGTLRPNNGAVTILGAVRILTVAQQMARASVVDKVATHSADLFPRLGNDTVDLSTRLIAILGWQTNFVASVRAQLPYGQNLFVLDVTQPDLATNRMEFVITADEIDPAGNIIHRKKGK